MPSVILDGPIREATRDCERWCNEWLAAKGISEKGAKVVAASLPVAGIGAVEVYKLVQRRRAKQSGGTPPSPPPGPAAAAPSQPDPQPAPAAAAEERPAADPPLARPGPPVRAGRVNGPSKGGPGGFLA